MKEYLIIRNKEQSPCLRLFQFFLLILFFSFSIKVNAQSDSITSPDTLSGTDSVKIITVTGKASYYANKFHGRKTANGEIFSNDSLTAAHKTLPFGTIVKVTHLGNSKSVVVKINDRLPPHSSRTIDLSQRAARDLGMIRAGLAKVQLEIIGP